MKVMTEMEVMMIGETRLLFRTKKKKKKWDESRKKEGMEIFRRHECLRQTFSASRMLLLRELLATDATGRLQSLESDGQKDII